MHIEMQNPSDKSKVSCKILGRCCSCNEYVVRISRNVEIFFKTVSERSKYAPYTRRFDVNLSISEIREGIRRIPIGATFLPYMMLRLPIRIRIPSLFANWCFIKRDIFFLRNQDANLNCIIPPCRYCSRSVQQKIYRRRKRRRRLFDR